MTNLPPVQLSDERMAEIAERCKGVTPGKRRLRTVRSPGWAQVGLDTGLEAGFESSAEFREDEAARLYVLLDPQTVLALLTELQHSRAEEAVAPEGMSAVLDALTEIGRHIDSSRGIGADAFYAIRGEIEKARAACVPASPASPSATAGVVAWQYVTTDGRSGVTLNPKRAQQLRDQDAIVRGLAPVDTRAVDASAMQSAIGQALLNAFPLDDKQADAYAAVAARAFSAIAGQP